MEGGKELIEPIGRGREGDREAGREGGIGREVIEVMEGGTENRWHGE